MIAAEEKLKIPAEPGLSLGVEPNDYVGASASEGTSRRSREVRAMRIRWRGLELPTRVVRDDATSTPTYGRFLIEPFERGFGTTVGNSLRRILLSSLEGAAVTHVRLKGADHEFMSIPGVLEDVTNIILNVKSLIVRLSGETPKAMRVNVKGQAKTMTPVRAEQIVCDPAIEIINKDQLLCTLTDAAEFDMEMTVAHGRSYATADDNKQGEDQVIGIIPVDSIFSPVNRVLYRVEDTRVGQRTNYDRLVLEIWTNGTITPEMALVEAAKILRKHLNPFVQYFELGSGLAIETADGQSDVASGGPDEGILAMPISRLELSVRSSNCLASAQIATIGELVQMDEGSLLKLRSFGKTSLNEVKRKLAEHGLSLKDGQPIDESGEMDEEAGDEMQTSPGMLGGLDSGSMPARGALDSMSGHYTPPPSNDPAASNPGFNG